MSKKKIIYKKLSFKLNGLFFDVHNQLGHYCNERQYADEFEKLLEIENIKYEREYGGNALKANIPKGNKIDFLIEEKLVIEFKAKRMLTKDDYYQVQRYLNSLDLELGILVNFRNKYLRPKRILNSSYSGYLDLNSRHSDHTKGFIALTSILIISAIALAVAVSISLLGIGEARNSLDYKKGREALYLAYGCVDEALLQLKLDETYTGGALSLGNGTCNIVISGVGSEKTIDVEAEIPGTPRFVKRLQAQTKRANNHINVLNFTELP